MNGDPIFETETMADLCTRQGRVGEAISIYRRLLGSESADAPSRARWRSRLQTLEKSWQPPTESVPADLPLPRAPGVAVLANEDQLTLAWALPPETISPALEVFVIQRTPAGIDTFKNTLPVAHLSGRLGLAVPGLHSALAAAGFITEGRFVPVARASSNK